MTVQELVTSWGFEVDSKPLEGLKEQIQGVKDGLQTAVKFIAAAEAALAALVITTIQEQKAFAALAFDTGIAVEKLQNHARAAQLAGVPLETYTGAIQSLAQNLNELAINPMSDAAVKMRFMGIQTHDSAGKIKDATDVMIQFGEKLGQMTDAHKRAAYATAILGSNAGALMPFLSKTKDGIGALLIEARELGLVLSEEDHKAILQTGEILNWFKMAAIGLKNQLVTGLNPALGQAAEGFKTWYKENAVFIRSGLIETLKSLVWILGMVTIGIASTIDAVKWIVDLFGGWERSAALAKIALALLSTVIAINLTAAALAATPALLAMAQSWILAMAPAIALATLIVGIGLVIDDLITYVNGGDSAIGSFVKSLQDSGGLLEAIGDALEYVFKGGLGNDLFDAFDAVSEAIGETWDQLSAFVDLLTNRGLIGVAEAIGAALESAFNGLMEILAALPGKAWNAMKQIAAALKAIPGMLGDAFSAIGGFIRTAITEAVSAGIDLITGLPGRIKGFIKLGLYGTQGSQAAAPAAGVARSPITPIGDFRPGSFSPAAEARSAANRITATGGNVTLNLKSESKIEGVTDPKEAAELNAAAQDKMIKGHLANLQRTASDAATAPIRY